MIINESELETEFEEDFYERENARKEK